MIIALIPRSVEPAPLSVAKATRRAAQSQLCTGRLGARRRSESGNFQLLRSYIKTGLIELKRPAAEHGVAEHHRIDHTIYLFYLDYCRMMPVAGAHLDQPHNPKVAGSNPAPATRSSRKAKYFTVLGFFYSAVAASPRRNATRPRRRRWYRPWFRPRCEHEPRSAPAGWRTRSGTMFVSSR